MTTVSDAPSCGVTYDCHPDDSRGVIYDRSIFIIQATGVSNMVTADLANFHHLVSNYLGFILHLGISMVPLQNSHF